MYRKRETPVQLSVFSYLDQCMDFSREHSEIVDSNFLENFHLNLNLTHLRLFLAFWFIFMLTVHSQ